MIDHDSHQLLLVRHLIFTDYGLKFLESASHIDQDSLSLQVATLNLGAYQVLLLRDMHYGDSYVGILNYLEYFLIKLGVHPRLKYNGGILEKLITLSIYILL